MAPRWIYLPGLGTGTRTRKGAQLAEALARQGDALQILDLRLPDPSRIRLSAMVEAARAALPPAGIPAFVVGTSLGGAAAAALAARESRLSGVVLLAPALHLGDLARGRPWLAGLAYLGVPYFDRHDGRPRLLDRGFFADAEALQLSERPPRCPVLVVHGRDDRRVPIEVSRAWAARHPGVRLLEVPDGHDLFRVWPAVEERILAFAGELGGGAADPSGEDGERLGA
jgi:pimeloyl-ACP methyl ester carboxylesterase